MILSLINAVIFIYLTVLHFRSNRMTRTYGEIFCKVKSCILISLSIFEIIVCGRYTLYFTGEAYNAILIVQQFLQSFILFQICYFYAKKAAHFVEESETLRKRMRIVMYIAVSSFVAILLYEVISHIVNGADDKSKLCHRFYFNFVNFFNQLSNCFFLVLGYRVNKNVKQINSHQQALIGDSTDMDLMVESSRKEIQFRKKAVRDMLIIIGTIFIVEMYTTLYSITLTIWGDEECYVQHTVWVRSVSTVV